jgi:hypothetical protein
MALNSSYEAPIQNLHPNIISIGSFEKNGSYPYVYNNEQNAIVILKIDSDTMEETINNVVYQYKQVIYANKTLTVPVLVDSIWYQEIEKIAKNNNCLVSFMFVMEIYKQLNANVDPNGMLVLGFKYDVENQAKFKTIGIRGMFAPNNGTYGVYLWLEALQYDKNDDGDIIITSLGSTNKIYFPYDYSLENLTTMFMFDYSDGENLIIDVKSVEKKPDGSRILDQQFSLNINIDLSTIEKFLTMNELNKTIQYSFYHIKTFGAKLTPEELDYQSKILVYA